MSSMEAAQLAADRPAAGWLRPSVARIILLVDLVLLLSALTLWITERVPVPQLAQLYLLGDAAIGASFAVCGGIVAIRAPGNRIGWLMLAGGSLYVVATAAGSVAYIRISGGDTGTLSRILTLVYTTAWMPAILILLPLAVQLFPSGRPLGRWGRALAAGTLVVGTTVTLLWITSPDLLTGTGLDDERPLVPTPLSELLSAA